MTEDAIIWFWLNTTYACGGVAVKEKVFVDACPIYRWMIGKTVKEVVSYLQRTGKYLSSEEIK